MTQSEYGMPDQNLIGGNLGQPQNGAGTNGLVGACSENQMLINQKKNLIQQIDARMDDCRSAASDESDLIVNQGVQSQHSSSHLRREKILNIQFNPSEYGILN